MKMGMNLLSGAHVGTVHEQYNVTSLGRPECLKKALNPFFLFRRLFRCSACRKKCSSLSDIKVNEFYFLLGFIQSHKVGTVSYRYP
jgi:hypothetical protein